MNRRTFTLVALLALCSFAGGFVAENVPAVFAQDGEAKTATFDLVRTKKLSVVNKDGKSVATLEASGGGAGLWITAPSGDMIAIYGVENQMGIGFYSKEHLKKGGPMTFAIGPGKGGVQIQVREGDGEPFWLTAADLRRIAVK